MIFEQRFEPVRGHFSVAIAPVSPVRGPSSASVPFVNNVGEYWNTPARIAGEDLRKGRGEWGHAVTRFSGSKFATALQPRGVAKFALVGLGPSTMIGAVVGVGSLYLAADVEWGNFVALGAAWWLRDAAGALVITPVVVLCSVADFRGFNLDKVLASGATIVVASAVGLIAFSPLIEQSVNRSALGFLAVLPLLWAALRCGGRDTATAVLILSCFAAWGTLAGGAPLAGATLVQAPLPPTAALVC